MVLELLVMMAAPSAFVGVDGMGGISCDGWFGNGQRWEDGRKRHQKYSSMGGFSEAGQRFQWLNLGFGD